MDKATSNSWSLHTLHLELETNTAENQNVVSSLYDEVLNEMEDNNKVLGRIHYSLVGGTST